jgi:hypothetical protein
MHRRRVRRGSHRDGGAHTPLRVCGGMGTDPVCCDALGSLFLGREQPDRDALVARVSADVRAALGQYVQDDGFAFPQEVQVALASV